jgi:hypothetical protein
MRVCWITDDLRHPARLAPGLGEDYSTVPADMNDWADPEASVLAVYANAGPGSRSACLGLRALERLRREQNCRKPALVYSFEDRELLMNEFPLLEPESPGIDFLRLPTFKDELAVKVTALSAAGDIDRETFRLVQRWYSGLQKEWVPRTHHFEQLIRGLPDTRGDSIKALTETADLLARYALDAEQPYNDLRCEIETCDYQTAKRHFERLTDRFAGRSAAPGAASLEGLPRTAIRAFNSIMIADDGEYPPETVLGLQRLGYGICTMPRSLHPAISELHRHRPSVIFADYQFGTLEAGRHFMDVALASDWHPIVLAISRTSVNDGHLPDGVLNLTGPDRYCDPVQLHAAISRTAMAHQAKSEGS